MVRVLSLTCPRVNPKICSQEWFMRSIQYDLFIWLWILASRRRHVLGKLISSNYKFDKNCRCSISTTNINAAEPVVCLLSYRKRERPCCYWNHDSAIHCHFWDYCLMISASPLILLDLYKRENESVDGETEEPEGVLNLVEWCIWNHV